MTVERAWSPMEVEFPGGFACTERLQGRRSIAWLRPQRFRALCQRSFFLKFCVQRRCVLKQRGPRNILKRCNPDYLVKTAVL